MKKTLKLPFVAFVFALFSNMALAQSTAKEDAMLQTKELKQLAEFEMNAFKPVYEVYLKYDRKLESIKKHIDEGTMPYMEATEKLKNVFMKDMKAVLTPEQYEVFLTKEKLK